MQTPTTPGETGISYLQTGSSSSALKVYTQGFLFCGNVGDGGSSSGSSLVLTAAHEDQAFTPTAHAWKFGAANAGTFAYTGSQLSVTPASNLSCLSTSNDGAVASGLYEGIFDNGYDSSAETNFRHLVNLNPATGFNWSAPDWTQVPADACGADAYQQARVPEDTACAAVTGP